MRSILVHVDGGPRSAVRMRVAARLAHEEGLQLTALFAAAPPPVDAPFGYSAGGMATPLMESVYRRWRDAAFDAAESVSRTVPVAWADLGAEAPVAGFVRQALHADLLVLGQHDPGEPHHAVPAGFVSGVLLASGRPGLVLPRSGPVGTVGRRVLVAWNRSTPAMRALSAALPLLRRAEHVAVEEWTVHGDAADEDARGRLAAYLDAHGVKAEHRCHAAAPRPVGERLLARAGELEADLLVMGCYGRPRSLEWMLGGATRTVLGRMALPVLMCH